MKLLATCTGPGGLGTWELHHNAACDSSRWRSLVLIRPVPARNPKEYGTSQTYFFGWNGDRLSATADFMRLRKQWPAVLDWVNDTLPTVTWWEEAK